MENLRTQLTSLVTMGQHVPRVVTALSSSRPFLTSFVFIAAVITETARLGTVWNHPFRVVVAFATGGPRVAFIVFVTTVGTVPFVPSTATTSATTRLPTSSGSFADSVSVVTRLQPVSEVIFDSLALPGIESGGAGSLRTRLRADALALVVLVAGLLAGGVFGAVVGATVHYVNDAFIRESQVLLGTDRKLVILVSGDNGHFPIVGKRVGAVVHDRAVVIRHSKWSGSRHLVEVESHASFDILKLNNKCFISVYATLLVMQADGVTDFVKGR